MNCNPTQSDIITALQNKKAFHNIRQGMSREESLDYLIFDNNNFEKQEGKYTLKGTTQSLKTTVTTKLNKGNTFTSDRSEGTAETGNYIHDVLEEYGYQVLQQIQGLSVKDALIKLENIRQSNLQIQGKTLDQQSRNNLFDIIIDQFKFTYEAQKLINTKQGINEVPIIKLEQLIIDPVDNLGGTIDFLGILSDNTFVIRDYKTASQQERNIDENGNLKPDVNLIHYKSLEKYKLQLQHYSKILINRYGFKGVYSSRLIPIKYYSKFNKITKKFDDNITYVAGPGQDKQIQEIIPFSEKTGFQSLDDFISKIDERIDKLARNRDVAKRQTNATKIAQLNLIKQEMMTKKTLDEILRYLQNIANTDVASLSLEEVLNIKQELDLFKTLTEVTHEYKLFLEKDGKDTTELENQLRILNNLVNFYSISVKEELFNKRLDFIVTDSTGEKLFDAGGNVIPFVPDGYFAQWFYQLSQFNNPIFQALKSKLDSAHAEKHNKIEELTKKVIKTETDVLRKLKEKGMTWDQFIGLILNDKDNLISKIDKDWYQSLDSIDNKDLHNYFNVVEYYDFKTRRQQFEDKLNDLYSDPTIVLKELEEYDKLFNLELNQDGTPKYPTAWRKAKQSNKLVLKEDVIVYNKEFQQIRNVPEFLAYYNLLEESNREFRKLLGVSFKELPNNFIPNIRKNSSERIEEWGLIKGTSSSVKDFIQDFSVREDDRTTEDSYLKRDSIPRFYLNPFRDKNGDIIKGEKSYQLGRSLLIFAKMVYNFNEMSKIEAEVLAMREFLLEKGQEVEQGKDGLKVNLLGNIKTIKTTDLSTTFDKFVQMYLYGLHVEPVLDDKSGKYEKALLQMKNYFTLKKLGLNIISATGGYLSAKIQATITGKVGIYYNEKQYNQSLRSMVKDREKFLALSAFFDPMGHRYSSIRLEEDKKGEMQLKDSSQRGWINQYVNTRLLMKPYSLGDENIEEVITYALAQNYYVNSNGILKKAQFEEDYETHKGRFIIDLFQFKDGEAKLNLSDEQSKKIWIAFRNAVQVVQSGIKGTIPDQDKAVWQGQLAGHLLGNFKSWIPGVMTERFGKIKYDKRVDTVYMGRFTAIMQEFGSSRNNSKNEVLQIGQFTKEILLPKLGQLALNIASFHTIGGYFKGFKMKDDGTVKLMYEHWLRQNPQYQGKVSYAEFRNVQEKQLKAAIIEMRMILTFMLLATLAMGDWDDDGEKDYRKYLLTRKLVSVILKVKQEISFFVNPTEFINLTKNPIPMIGLLQDAVKTISNTTDEIIDVAFKGSVVLGKETTIVGEDKKDKKNLLSYSHSWIPGMGGLAQFLELLSDDTQYANTTQ